MSYKGYNIKYGNNNEQLKKKIIFSVVFLVVSIIIAFVIFANNSVTNNIKKVVKAPFVYVSNCITNTFSNITNVFKDKENILAENEKLKQEVDTLKLSLIEMQGIIDENTSLKEMLQIKNNFKHYNLKCANVIYKYADSYSLKLTVDVGSKDNIEINDVVIHKDGLVGYVSTVYEDSCVITTLLDVTFAVSSKFSTTGATAMAICTTDQNITKYIKVKDIELGLEVLPNEKVYTSGIGTIYPTGIPIGEVVTVSGKKNESYRYAIIKPFVNVEEVREVAIIMR